MEKINFVNGQSPYISATNLNNLQDNVGNAINNSLPIGTIVDFAGTIAPTGWLICDGSAISRTTYADLLATIGTIYGEGDGSTTFNLPNCEGLVTVGIKYSDTDFSSIGKKGGEKEVTLTKEQIPSHNHEIPELQDNDGGHTYTRNITRATRNTATETFKAWWGNTGDTGGGQPHNNLQPYICFSKIIKALKS